jgi:septal ring factor EnvC (AmiA/AmiB activator)
MTKQRGPQGFSDTANRGAVGRDPAEEAQLKDQREKRNSIARTKRALDRARGELYDAERILQMWRDEETRLNSSRINQISEARAHLETKRGVVLGLQGKLNALGAG